MNIFGRINEKKNEAIDLYRRQPPEIKYMIGMGTAIGLSVTYTIYIIATQGFPENLNFEYISGMIRW